jgi:hypothetical protein
MTLEPDLIVGADVDSSAEHEPMQLAGGRVVSLRFMRTALRRRRRLWLSLAAAGLLVGAGYHLVVPVKYSAISTLYLAAPPGTDQTVASSDNLAMLQTAGVGQRAIALLGEHGITPSELLGKEPGTAVSDNVLTITISGPSSAEAVRRVNAVATAYLAFRAQQVNAQNQALVTAANQQIAKLQSQISGLTARINALGAPATSQQLSSLVTQRSTATSQVADLQQSVQTDNLDTLSVSKGSRVITSGTPVDTSKKKVLVLDGLTGLAAGLGLGLFVVVLEAVLSDRLRRREDIAAVLGAPVDVSVGRVGRRGLFFRSSIRAMVSAPEPGVQILAQYLGDRLAVSGPKPTELVVAVDDVGVPAAAMAVLAGTLSSAGKRVVLVDSTANRVLGRALGASQVGFRAVPVGRAPSVTLLVPPKPWEPDEDGRWEAGLAEAADADAVLVVATVDPAVGAWHLRSWAADAVLAVSAGRSTGQRIDAVAELLDAADVTVSSAVLLGADADDESVGLPEPGASVFGRRLGSVHRAMATLT